MLAELVERVFNPSYTTLVVFPHDLIDDDDILLGNRESVLAQIELLNCGGNNDEVDYEGEIANALSDLNGVANSFDELKIVVISLCEPESGDNTCNLHSSLDPNGNIEVTIINIGTDVSNSDQFSCLVNGGVISPNYNEYDSINDALDDAEHLEDEICERPTPNPTRMMFYFCINLTFALFCV